MLELELLLLPHPSQFYAVWLLTELSPDCFHPHFLLKGAVVVQVGPLPQQELVVVVGPEVVGVQGGRVEWWQGQEEQQGQWSPSPASDTRLLYAPPAPVQRVCSELGLCLLENEEPAVHASWSGQKEQHLPDCRSSAPTRVWDPATDGSLEWLGCTLSL